MSLNGPTGNGFIDLILTCTGLIMNYLVDRSVDWLADWLVLLQATEDICLPKKVLFDRWPWLQSVFELRYI